MDNQITEMQALEKAREVGEAAYRDISMFATTVTEDSSHWMVHFTNAQAVADGESQHFSVRVDKRTGDAKLFRGR